MTSSSRGLLAALLVLLMALPTAAAASDTAPRAATVDRAALRDGLVRTEATSTSSQTAGVPSIDCADDPPGDTIALPSERPVRDDRADVLQVCAEYGYTLLLELHVAARTDPATDPAWDGVTAASWLIDTDTDRAFVADLIREPSGRVVGEVYELQGDHLVFVCGASPREDARRYRLDVNPHCLGDPAGVLIAGLMFYDTNPASASAPVHFDISDTDIHVTRSRERQTQRVAGRSRIATSVALSRRTFPGEAPVVYLTRADGLADAVVSGVLLDGPVLLVPSCGDLPAEVASDIERLDPHRIVGLGGERAVCQALLDQAAAVPTRRSPPEPDPEPEPEPEDPTPIPLPPLPPVPPSVTPATTSATSASASSSRPTSRLAGPSRIDTAVEISRAAFPQRADEVLLGRADVFADAVAGAALGRPLLLVPSCGQLPAAVAEEIRRLGPGSVRALGGTAAVCDDLLAQAAGAAGARAERTAGGDRFSTAARIAALHPRAGEVDEVLLANGLTFADAVAAGSRVGVPVLLVPGQGLIPRVVKLEILRQDPDVVTALGGEGAVSRGSHSHAAW